MSDGKLIIDTGLDTSGVKKDIKDFETNTGKSLDKVSESFAKTGAMATSYLTKPILAAGAAFFGTAELTRDYRREMAKLDAAFAARGHSVAATEKTYQDLQAVLGETDQAVEAANHLAILCDNEEQLADWTNICTGVYATFGASLPIEGLTEAANETAKVGQVTGPLADALNWVGISEDKFNAQLAACNSEQERAVLITETLNQAYSKSADLYKRSAEDILEANRAQERLNNAMARIGAVAEPLLTMLKNAGSLGLEIVAALLEQFGKLPDFIQGGALAFALLLAAAGPVLTITSKLITSYQTIAGVLPKVTKLLKVNTTATIANAAAANAAGKAQLFLGKAMAAGKYMLIAAAIAAAGFLLYKFAQDTDAATAMVTGLVDKFESVVTSIAEALPVLLPTLVDAVIDMLMCVVDALPQIITAVCGALPGIVDKIAAFLPVLIPKLMNAAVLLFTAFVDAIQKALPAILAALPQIIDAIVNVITTSQPQIMDAGVKLLMALVDAIPLIIVAVVKAIPAIVRAMVSTFKSMFGLIFNVGVELLKKLWNGVSSLAGWLKNKLYSFAKSLPGRIRAGLGSLFGIGSNFMQGLLNGINSRIGAIMNRINNLGSNIKRAFQRALQIFSPSRFTTWLGKMLDEGLAIGIVDNTKKVLSAIRGQGRDIRDEYDGFEPYGYSGPIPQAYTGAAFAGGGVLAGEAAGGVNQTVNIYQPVSTPAETARAIRNQMTFGLAGE